VQQCHARSCQLRFNEPCIQDPSDEMQCLPDNQYSRNCINSLCAGAALRVLKQLHLVTELKGQPKLVRRRPPLGFCSLLISPPPPRSTRCDGKQASERCAGRKTRWRRSSGTACTGRASGDAAAVNIFYEQPFHAYTSQEYLRAPGIMTRRTRAVAARSTRQRRTFTTAC
jgi:hypothetical protein